MSFCRDYYPSQPISQAVMMTADGPLISVLAEQTLFHWSDPAEAAHEASPRDSSNNGPYQQLVLFQGVVSDSKTYMDLLSISNIQFSALHIVSKLYRRCPHYNLDTQEASSESRGKRVCGLTFRKLGLF